ncbi:MAG: cobalt-zinc-cadmium efflux system protein [Qipengyuania sp.]|jgi:cobalt-zinc-cadmium efflux system protein
MLKEEFQIEHATFEACFETDCEADLVPAHQTAHPHEVGGPHQP